MCGICGFTGSKNSELLKTMTRVLEHRGPDDDGYLSEDKINLGMRRLSIIDLKTGQQPMHNEDKSVWVVFNGEIYNFKEIRQELKEQGHKLYTDHSDTEVITHLYEQYGDSFANKLNGMFAIALWDKKADKLLLVRDRMGVKPLFYTQLNGDLIFASEIKSLLLHPGYRCEVNPEAVYHYLSFKNIPAPLTAFKNIYSLNPGEILTFSKGKISKEIWWKVSFKEDHQADEESTKETILNLLEDATKLRMRCDVPFGAYLSGGVDSSAVVALMTRFSDKPIKTFSLGYEDELKNKEADLFYARKMSEKYKTEHYEYIMSHQELIDDVENVISAFDQPFSGVISTFFITKLIKKHVKVALSGDGADELFGSYLSHRTAQPIHHFKNLHDKIKAGTLSEKEKELLKPCDIRFLEDLFRKSSGDELSWRYNLYNFTDEEKSYLLSDEFKSQLGHASTFKLLENEFKTLTASDPLNRILELEWNTQLPDQVLAFVDFLSMAHSVEVRSPFLDYRLVEFVATIPGNLKIRNGNVKDILKNSVKSLLSEEIVKRPKEGFVMPIFDWMMDNLKSYSLDLLSESRLKKHGYFNAKAVSNILRSYHSGNKTLVSKVWNLMMFQIWWEKYFA